MKRGVCLYLVGSLALISLAGCGRGLFQFQTREPWRAEAEVACLKSGVVRETADLVRVKPIDGPGICGAEYPLKVAVLGETNMRLGFANDLRPPGSIGGGATQPRWPVKPQYVPPPAPAPSYPSQVDQRFDNAPRGNAPVSLSAPPETEPAMPDSMASSSGYFDRRMEQRAPSPSRYDEPPVAYPAAPRLGVRDQVPVQNAVAIKPAATLACPIVSALDRWLTDAIQPAAMRWFGTRVVEIKQISAYSCRGMNGNSRAKISEHAFGNALDIASFTLADGRRISVKDGWKGMPEEQGFLRDVQSAACEQFTTVLAPGSNIYHYDHIHVDLMRRKSGRGICRPEAISGEEIASRAFQRGRYANGSQLVTGSIGKRAAASKRADDDDETYLNE